MFMGIDCASAKRSAYGRLEPIGLAFNFVGISYELMQTTNRSNASNPHFYGSRRRFALQSPFLDLTMRTRGHTLKEDVKSEDWPRIVNALPSDIKMRSITLIVTVSFDLAYLSEMTGTNE